MSLPRPSSGRDGGGANPPPPSERPRTVGEVLKWTEGLFRDLGLPTPRLDAEVLLAGALGVGRLDLYLGYERPLEPEERDRFRALVKRRSRREPVAYILGRREFYSLSFEVGPAVLVPRPETEHVVEAAVEALRALPEGEPATVLELGTGSGNIAISIAFQVPSATIDTIDPSADALALARKNAATHGVEDRIRFLQGDLFEPVANDRRYRIIVSNPPYVRAEDMPELAPEVRLHEPALALVDSKSAQSDGLGFYREIATRGPAFLLPSGKIIVEVGAEQARDVAAIFEAARLTDIETRPDLAGIDRVVIASRRSS